MTTDEGSAGEIDEVRAGDVARVARVLFAPGTVAETLSRVVQGALRVVEGCDEAGVCGGTVKLPGMPSTPLAYELGDLQVCLQEGPCVDALTDDEVYSPDLTADRRWPRLGPMVAPTGVRSALAYRLFGGDTLGVLHLYSARVDAFGPRTRSIGAIFAACAGVAMETAQSHAASAERIAHLRSALASRETIGQAAGIVMVREQVPPEHAFALLRDASQRLNMKLRDLARQVVETGALPDHAATAGSFVALKQYAAAPPVESGDAPGGVDI